MKAIYSDEHGDISKLQYGEVEKPTPKKNEALIKVEAVALNHLDIWIRRGWKGLRLDLPHIGGSDITGIIEQIEPNPNFNIGDSVILTPGFTTEKDHWTKNNLDSLSPNYEIIGESRKGGLAEFITIPTKCLVKCDPTIAPEKRVAPLLVGLTAWRMLFKQAKLKKERHY